MRSGERWLASVPPPDRRWVVEVGEQGLLPVPEEVREALGLEAGDRVAIEPFPLSCRLLRLRDLELFQAGAEVVFVGSLEREGLHVPARCLALPPGRHVMLQLLRRGFQAEAHFALEEPG